MTVKVSPARCRLVSPSCLVRLSLVAARRHGREPHVGRGDHLPEPVPQDIRGQRDPPVTIHPLGQPGQPDDGIGRLGEAVGRVLSAAHLVQPLAQPHGPFERPLPGAPDILLSLLRTGERGGRRRRHRLGVGRLAGVGAGARSSASAAAFSADSVEFQAATWSSRRA